MASPVSKSLVHVQVLVGVADVNDNPPVIVSAAPRHIYVKEDERIGTVMASVRAVDYDHGPFGRVTYRLDDAPGKFSFIVPCY